MHVVSDQPQKKMKMHMLKIAPHLRVFFSEKLSRVIGSVCFVLSG